MKRFGWIAGVAALALIAVAAVIAAQNPDKEGVELPFQEEISDATSSSSSSRIEVPAGTVMKVSLQTSLSTKTAEAGDRFTAVVAEPVTLDGRTAVPSGAAVRGHVVLSEQPGKASGRGKLQLAFDELEFNGTHYELGTVGSVMESESGADKDAAIIGGGAVAGGIIGGVVGGDAGDAAKGAIIGGAAGTATSLMTRGPQLELPQGTTLQIRLDESISVRAPRATS